MIGAGFEGNLYLILALVAFLTALFGLILLNSLFKEKSEHLYKEAHFFTFFILIWGYVLFALGELGWFLVYKVFGETYTASMSDFYWVAGQIFMIISFIALNVGLHQTHKDLGKLLTQVLFGVVILGGVLFYLSSIGIWENQTQESGNQILGNIYPIASAIILILSFNLLMFYKKMEFSGKHILLLFFANIFFLVGDLLYVYTTININANLISNLSDGLYVVAYTLSALAFITLLIKIHGSKRISA